MIVTTDTLERASSPLACARCDEPLAVDEVFVQRLGRGPRGDAPSRLHPACALDADPRAFLAVLRSDEASFDGRSSLRALANKRVEAIEARANARWTTARTANGDQPGLAPRRGFEDDPSLVAPARDPKGRPRVRVLVHGTAVGSNEKFWSLLREGAWASSRREYAFVPVGGWEVIGEEDPAQPVVAVVYAARAQKNANLEQEPWLWLLGALGLRAPLLWLHGIKEFDARDDNVLRVRAHVDACGITSDACPLLCAPRMTPEALDALVAALDEHASGAELRAEGSPALAFAEALRRDVSDEVPSTDRQFQLRLHFACWGHTPRSRAALESVAEALVSRGDSVRAAMVLSQRVSEDRSLYERWLALELARGDQPATPWLTSALRAYARCGPATDAALELAVRASTNQRFNAIVELLGELVTVSSVGAARDALARIEPADRRRAFAEKLAGWQQRLSTEPSR
jgi:hypothetical protein